MSPTNESIIYGFLVNDLHLTKAGAAGVLGNLQVESGFDPTKPNPTEGAIGLAQWENPNHGSTGRRTDLQHYAAAHGGKETDLTMQLGYLAKELGGSYSSVLRFLRKTNDPVAAAAYFDVGPGGAHSGTGFENSSGDATATRQADAQTIYGQIKRGQLTASKAPPGTPAPGGMLQAGGGVADNVLNDVTGGIASTTGDVVNSISSIFDFSWVVQLVVKSAFTIGGLGLVVLGLYSAAQPAREAAHDAAGDVGQAAAIGAAL